MAVEGLSSTLTLTNLTSSRASDISSRIGEMRRHGTHQGAQKSTITGLSERRTSLSKVASVTSATAILSNLHWSLEQFSRNILAREIRQQATGFRLQRNWNRVAWWRGRIPKARRRLPACGSSENSVDSRLRVPE